MIKMMIRWIIWLNLSMGSNGWSFHIKFTVKQRHESRPYLQIGFDPNLATSRVVWTAGVLKDPSCLGENCKSMCLLKKAENTSQPPLYINIYIYLYIMFIHTIRCDGCVFQADLRKGLPMWGADLSCENSGWYQHRKGRPATRFPAEGLGRKAWGFLLVINGLH